MNDPFKLRLRAEEDIFPGAFVYAVAGYGLRLARDGLEGLPLGQLTIAVKAGEVVDVETSVQHAAAWVLSQGAANQISADIESMSGGAMFLAGAGPRLT